MVQICAYWKSHIKNISSTHTNLDIQVVIVKSGYNFSFYEVLEMCCFIFSVNERVVVSKGKYNTKAH